MKMRAIKNKNQQLRTITTRHVLIIWSWIFSLTWLVLTFYFQPRSQIESQTAKNLLNIKTVVNYFIEEFQQTPLNMNMIRAYGKSLKQSVLPYDALGQRLDYIRLTPQHFVVRSFGYDGKQNTHQRHSDLITGVLIRPPQDGYLYSYLKPDQRQTYDATAVLGTESPNRLWYGRIYIDSLTNKRHLVIRHKQRSNFYMLALHDQVEEFLWLPTSHHIVFTATSSGVYNDGVYLWDIVNDSITNLLDQSAINNKLTLFNLSEEKMHLSLGGVYEDENQVLLFAYPNKDQPLDPLNFYSNQNTFLLKIDVNQKQTSIIENHWQSSSAQTANASFWLDINSFRILGEKGTVTQKDWRALPLRGLPNEAIDRWQEFIRKYPDSAVVPYALWYLTLLYHEVYKNEPNAQNAVALRTFAAEIAKALVEFHTAPSYLQAMAAHMYQSFNQNKKLPISFGFFNSQNSK